MKNQHKAAYEYEIKYSRTSIWVEGALGLFFVFGSVALAIWLKEWWALFFSLIGAFMLWEAIGRGRQPGPQLKIGRQGIWTFEAGHHPWASVLVEVKTEKNSRSVITWLIIVKRTDPTQEIARLSTDHLDVDVRSLKAHLRRFASR